MQKTRRKRRGAKVLAFSALALFMALSIGLTWAFWQGGVHAPMPDHGDGTINIGTAQPTYTQFNVGAGVNPAAGADRLIPQGVFDTLPADSPVIPGDVRRMRIYIPIRWEDDDPILGNENPGAIGIIPGQLNIRLAQEGHSNDPVVQGNHGIIGLATTDERGAYATGGTANLGLSNEVGPTGTPFIAANGWRFRNPHVATLPTGSATNVRYGNFLANPALNEERQVDVTGADATVPPLFDVTFAIGTGTGTGTAFSVDPTNTGERRMPGHGLAADNGEHFTILGNTQYTIRVTIYMHIPLNAEMYHYVHAREFRFHVEFTMNHGNDTGLGDPRAPRP